MPEWLNGVVLVVSGVIVIIGKDIIENRKKKSKNGSTLCDAHKTIVKDLSEGREVMRDLGTTLTEVKTDIKWLINQR